MSSIKALDVLRELATGSHSYISNRRVLESVNEIEQEIVEKYIALPLDSEGVPIHPGDTLKYCSEDIIDARGENLGNVEGCEEVLFLAFDGYGECIALESEGWRDLQFTSDHSDMNFVHAAKPRTIEDVLREFAERYLDYEGMPSAGRRGVSEALMDEYADEIRGMMA